MEKPERGQIAEFLEHSALDNYNVVGMSAVLAGSRASGLEVEGSDSDYLGIHMMDTNDCLEHPDFRPQVQVLRQKFDANLDEIPDGIKGGEVSLDSFELWKFTTLFLKGSHVAYELLYLPKTYVTPSAQDIFDVMKTGVTNRLGKAARGVIIHDWAKNKNSRKKTIIAYYRAMQAIYFLRENEFVSDWNKLIEYMKPTGLVNGAQSEFVHGLYMDPKTRNLPVKGGIKEISKELSALVDEVDKACVFTKYPDQVPRKALKDILQVVKKSRSLFI